MPNIFNGLIISLEISVVFPGELNSRNFLTKSTKTKIDFYDFSGVKELSVQLEAWATKQSTYPSGQNTPNPEEQLVNPAKRRLTKVNFVSP